MEAERKEYSLVAEAINEANIISDSMDAGVSGPRAGEGGARGKAAARGGTRAGGGGGGGEIQVPTASFVVPFFFCLCQRCIRRRGGIRWEIDVQMED